MPKYTTDGGGGTTWAAAGSVSGDTVLEQVETVYDPDGNLIETIDRQRFHDATGTGPWAVRPAASGRASTTRPRITMTPTAQRRRWTWGPTAAGVDPAWQRAGGLRTVLVTSYIYNAAGLLKER